jgi:hypothetical protein
MDAMRCSQHYGMSVHGCIFSGRFTLAGTLSTSDGTRRQMAYEDVCAGRADWGGLVKLLWYKLTAWLWKRFLGDGTGTLFVNAAAVSD